MKIRIKNSYWGIVKEFDSKKELIKYIKDYDNKFNFDEAIANMHKLNKLSIEKIIDIYFSDYVIMKKENYKQYLKK